MIKSVILDNNLSDKEKLQKIALNLAINDPSDADIQCLIQDFTNNTKKVLEIANRIETVDIYERKVNVKKVFGHLNLFCFYEKLLELLPIFKAKTTKFNAYKEIHKEFYLSNSTKIMIQKELEKTLIKSAEKYKLVKEFFLKENFFNEKSSNLYISRRYHGPYGKRWFKTTSNINGWKGAEELYEKYHRTVECLIDYDDFCIKELTYKTQTENICLEQSNYTRRSDGWDWFLSKETEENFKDRVVEEIIDGFLKEIDKCL